MGHFRLLERVRVSDRTRPCLKGTQTCVCVCVCVCVFLDFKSAFLRVYQFQFSTRCYKSYFQQNWESESIFRNEGEMGQKEDDSCNKSLKRWWSNISEKSQNN